MTVRVLALTLLLATLALAACGGDDKGKGLPSTTASQLLSELNAVQNRIDQGSVGACEDVLNESVPALQKEVDGLPDDTDAGLRTALDDSVSNLRSVTEQDCDTKRQKAQDKKPETTETTPTPTPTETTPPPTTTETTPTTTTETTPKPKPAPKPKDNGNGNQKKDDSGGGGGAKAPSTGNGGGTALPVDPE
jgi:outer membrane biosynthesis protein TonB